MRGNIQYIYDATGVKLEKKVTEGVTITETFYAGNHVYEGSSLKFFNQPEGYVEPKDASDYSLGFEYIYQYKDHLGNIRLSYKNVGSTSTPSLQIQEENNYYPFGLKHKGYNNVVNSTNIAQNWKYEGQEFTEDLGLNTYEWKYRMSDPALGRFMQIDPLAEDYSYQSPYNFAENRVVDSAELEGLERIYAADGKFLNQVGDSKEIRVLNGTYNNSTANELVATANNTELSSEERAAASESLNSNSFHGYSNTDEAAAGFARANNLKSQKKNKEFGAAIYTVSLLNEDGSTQNNSVAILGPTIEGTRENVEVPKMLKGMEVERLGGNTPIGKLSGLVHTHGRGSVNLSTGSGALFSSDQSKSKANNVPIYMSNKIGQLRRGDFHLGDIKGKIIRRNIPGKWWEGY